MRKSIVSKSVDDMAQKIHYLQSVLFTLKFINNFSDDPLLKMLGPNSDPIYLELCISSRESLEISKGLTMRNSEGSYSISLCLKLENNEFTASLANEELVFFMASALITFPVMSAWMLLSSKLTS
ncbi:unnamed protein product [Prunus armeniaca]